MDAQKLAGETETRNQIGLAPRPCFKLSIYRFSLLFFTIYIYINIVSICLTKFW